MSGFNENGYHIANLIKLVGHLEENKDSINLYMEYFVESGVEPDEVNCGTSACIVGHAGEWFDMTEYDLELGGYISFSERLFMNNSGSIPWDFLFDARWPNDIEEAIGRLSYVIKHGDMPKSWNWNFGDSFK
ncbi:hypothetical protein N9043_00805 [bacterium]|nr:hypothetical protein [bacterium]